MRIAIDTSALIEWIVKSPLSNRLEAHWPPLEQMIIPTIVQHELYKWARREISESAADRAVTFTMSSLVVPLDTRIALHAAELAAEHRLATADAIIYATALGSDAMLLTCDAHFEGLSGVLLIGKT